MGFGLSERFVRLKGGRPTFYRVVRAGFSEKRKQLKNNLRQLGLSDEAIAAALEAAGIDGRRMAETLAVGEWEALVAALGNIVK